MKGLAVRLHPELHARVCSVLTAALRADVTAIDAVVDRAVGLDACTGDFLRESRRLVLACGAALLSVLDVHRPVVGPGAAGVCRGCGGHECRTLGSMIDVLDAYAVRPGGIDRAEAWRRADRFFNQGGGRASVVAVEDFGDGFVARAFTVTAEPDGPLLVVDRRTGGLTRWPPMTRQDLIGEYRRYRDSLR